MRGAAAKTCWCMADAGSQISERPRFWSRPDLRRLTQTLEVLPLLPSNSSSSLPPSAPPAPSGHSRHLFSCDSAHEIECDSCMTQGGGQGAGEWRCNEWLAGWRRCDLVGKLGSAGQQYSMRAESISGPSDCTRALETSSLWTTLHSVEDTTFLRLSLTAQGKSLVRWLRLALVLKCNSSFSRRLLVVLVRGLGSAGLAFPRLLKCLSLRSGGPAVEFPIGDRLCRAKHGTANGHR